MVLMNLFAEQKQRQRHREQMYGPRGQVGGGMDWEMEIYVCTLLCMK